MCWVGGWFQWNICLWSTTASGSSAVSHLLTFWNVTFWMLSTVVSVFLVISVPRQSFFVWHQLLDLHPGISISLAGSMLLLGTSIAMLSPRCAYLLAGGSWRICGFSCVVHKEFRYNSHFLHTHPVTQPKALETGQTSKRNIQAPWPTAGLELG